MLGKETGGRWNLVRVRGLRSRIAILKNSTTISPLFLRALYRQDLPSQAPRRFLLRPSRGILDAKIGARSVWKLEMVGLVGRELVERAVGL